MCPRQARWRKNARKKQNLISVRCGKRTPIPTVRLCMHTARVCLQHWERSNQARCHEHWARLLVALRDGQDHPSCRRVWFKRLAMCNASVASAQPRSRIAHRMKCRNPSTIAAPLRTKCAFWQLRSWWLSGRKRACLFHMSAWKRRHGKARNQRKRLSLGILFASRPANQNSVAVLVALGAASAVRHITSEGVSFIASVRKCNVVVVGSTARRWEDPYAFAARLYETKFVDEL